MASRTPRSYMRPVGRRRSFKAGRRSTALTGPRFKRTARRTPTESKTRSLTRIMANYTVRPPLGRSLDHDMLSFDQVMTARMLWTPSQAQPLGALGDHGDGFAISMNAMVNSFTGSTGVNAGGVPLALIAGTNGILFEFVGQSGSSGAPDGFFAMMDRFTYFTVLGGVYEITVSQDTQGTGPIQGSTQIAVCGFPSQASVTYLGGATSGHVVYNPNGATASNADEQSMSLLRAEPNCVSKRLDPFAGTTTQATIRYPFTVGKYAPYGFQYLPTYAQAGISAVSNPSYNTAQPFILTQFLSSGDPSPQLFRVEIRLRRYGRATMRKPVYNLH